MKTNWILLLLLCVSVSGCSGRSDILWEQAAETTKDGEYIEAESETSFTEKPPVQTETVSALIYVDVTGAVNEPGVVELSAGSRVYQAVEAAGGFSEDAAAEYTNQAAVLADGQQIHIYTQEEAQEQKIPATENTSDASDAGEAALEKVDLNTATKEELMTLPGIGESKAADIIQYREENGGFQTVEEIKNISGIKDAVFGKIRDRIAVTQ